MNVRTEQFILQYTAVSNERTEVAYLLLQGTSPLAKKFLIGFAQISVLALEESGWVQTHSWPRHCV